jgi:phosphoadenosine phosphosulfate reductase
VSPDGLRTERANAELERIDAVGRVRWALAELPGPQVLSSSFGAQAAVLLHLVTREQPDIPVVLVDTGYLFAETYRFVDELSMRLDLNLKVYLPRVSPAWLEARHGRLWENDLSDIERYNAIHKVEPMQRALAELGRRHLDRRPAPQPVGEPGRIRPLELRDGRFKLHPICSTGPIVTSAATSSEHGLPYHPLWEQGYISIGDWHTTRSLAEAGTEEATRFFGLKRECGIHGLEG